MLRQTQQPVGPGRVDPWVASGEELRHMVARVRTKESASKRAACEGVG
jgi:hypothetical protein